jgi:hypothetical protein
VADNLRTISWLFALSNAGNLVCKQYAFWRVGTECFSTMWMKYMLGGVKHWFYITDVSTSCSCILANSSRRSCHRLFVCLALNTEAINVCLSLNICVRQERFIIKIYVEGCCQSIVCMCMLQCYGMLNNLINKRRIVIDCSTFGSLCIVCLWGHFVLCVYHFTLLLCIIRSLWSNL